jgi:uncharacterized SAM-binding protein YcdF (DUF218 family)
MSAAKPELNAEIFQAAQIVWNYHRLDHKLEPVDLIFVLGSHDLRVAQHAADLFHRGLAPRVVLSGGLGRLTANVWPRPEAEMFATVLRERGVPETALLLESRSTNTGENIQFTRQLLAECGLTVRSIIGVQKPYMQRRAFASIRKQWPEAELRMSSPPIEFAHYGNADIPLYEVVQIMVGDLQRVMEYPKLGFAIPQEVPAHVMNAYQQLVTAGFTDHLITKISRA